MRFSDTLLGILLILFGLAIGIYSQSFPAIPGQRYGAAAFPTAIAIGFGLCGLVLLGTGLHSTRAPLLTRTEWTRKAGAMPAVLIAILCVLAYIWFMRRIGFIPVTLIVLVVLLRMLRVSWWQSVLYAAATAFVIDFIFRSLLLVPLPFGFMPRLPW